MNRFGAGALLVLLSLAAMPLRAGEAEPPSGPAQKQPAFAPPRDETLLAYEKESFAGSEQPSAARRETGDRGAGGAALRLVGALAVLGGLGVGGVMLMRKTLAGGRGLLRNQGIDVLARSYLDNKRYIALVRVGPRVMALGVSPEGIGNLAEFSDAGEVAELMREARPASEAGKNVFRSFLQKSVSKREPEAAESAPGGEADRLAQEMDTIGAELRGLREERG
jgi:flagellar biogenesis protein FliO